MDPLHLAGPLLIKPRLLSYPDFPLIKCKRLIRPRSRMRKIAGTRVQLAIVWQDLVRAQGSRAAPMLLKHCFPRYVYTGHSKRL